MVAGVIPVVVISVLLLANALFVAAEFAVAAASRPRVAHMAEEGSSAAANVLKILSSPVRISEYLSTAQVGITIASLGLGMYGEPAIARWMVPLLEEAGIHSEAAAHLIATVVTVAFLTYLHVVLGEMVPKSLALQTPSRAAVRLNGFMSITDKVFRPFTAVLNWVANSILHLFGLQATEVGTSLVTSEDLSYIVEASSLSGFLDRSEQVFLENVIDFHERSVGQIMTPRTRMVALSVDANRRSTLRAVCGQRYSRFPVYRDTRDNIVGVLHLKDLARQLLRTSDPFSIQEMMRPVVFVPETLPLDEMLERFRTERFQIAIVIDEYGGTAGLVTMEDLAEEIVGEIQDEFDEEIAPIQELAPGHLRVRGDLLLDELDQLYGVVLNADDAETVGGLVMSALGRVPRPGESVVISGVRIEVESVSGLAVNTALLDLQIEVDERERSDS